MSNFYELASSIEGEAYTDKVRTALLATDAGIFRIEPHAVVYPKNTDDVVKTLNFASSNNLAVHARGAGSGLCGGALGHGVVIDFSKFMNRLISLDVDKRTFTCEPGYRYGELERELAGSGLFFPPAPSSGEYASFGGMYSTNAGGAYSVKYGNVSDYITDAEVVLANGQIIRLASLAEVKAAHLPANLRELWRILSANKKLIKGGYPDVPTNVCGYELRDAVKGEQLQLLKLFGGAEGTLGIVTRLVFRLVEKPKHGALIIAYFSDLVTSAKAAQIAIAMSPAGIEIMDKSLINVALEHNPTLAEHIRAGADNVLMIEFEGNSKEEAAEAVEKCVEKIGRDAPAKELHIALEAEEAEHFWAVRKAAVPILYLLKGEKKILPLVEDAAIPSDRLVAYLGGLYKIFESFGVRFVIYGHIAKGLLHSRPLLNLKDPLDVAILKPIADDVFHLVRSLGGTISGEHGDGRLRTSYVPKQYWEIYEIFKHVKHLLDPDNLLNPDIITGDAGADLTQDLRYGWDYKAVEPAEKELIWDGGITNEIEKCHGCSKCTTLTSASRMCPIYKITRDESAAPKAKANLLRALISGKIKHKEQFSKEYISVIDSCIGCGSCHTECPSRVNIRKLCLEAKSAYALKFGVSAGNKLAANLEGAARHFGKAYALFYPLLKLTPFRKFTELTTGLSASRPALKLAFSSLYDRVRSVTGKGRKLLYFPGCYASYVRPELGEAAVSVLAKLGYEVLLPSTHCCGLPHVSKGLTNQARGKVEDNLREWGHALESVECVAVSCSSCGFALYKEWGNLLGGDITAAVSSKVKHISTLIMESGEAFKSAHDFTVYYHAPCHLAHTPMPSASRRILEGIRGLKVVNAANACCGMAGSWGAHKDNYLLSLKAAEPLLKSLRGGESDICVTDCPTCEMQIGALTGLKTAHPVEIIAAII